MTTLTTLTGIFRRRAIEVRVAEARLLPDPRDPRPVRTPQQKATDQAGLDAALGLRPRVDIAALIAAHTDGAGWALAATAGRPVEPFPVHRPIPGPTARDEAVGSLLREYTRLVAH